MDFLVRVHFQDLSSVILRGNSDTIGMYAVTREASGRGFLSVPAKRTSLEPERLKKPPPGVDADYDYAGVFTALG
jgi:hypothetical protein